MITRRGINRALGLGALSASPVLSALASRSEQAPVLPYDIAFSSWCFHMPLWRGELKAQSLPGIARDLGVNALEWTSKTFRDLKGGRELMFQAPAGSFF